MVAAAAEAVAAVAVYVQNKGEKKKWNAETLDAFPHSNTYSLEKKMMRGHTHKVCLSVT